jgi:hypothetical protein
LPSGNHHSNCFGIASSQISEFIIFSYYIYIFHLSTAFVSQVLYFYYPVPPNPRAILIVELFPIQKKPSMVLAAQAQRLGGWHGRKQFIPDGTAEVAAKDAAAKVQAHPEALPGRFLRNEHISLGWCKRKLQETTGNHHLIIKI